MSSKDFIVKNSLQISGGDLVFSKDSDGDLEVKNSSGTRKTLKVDKIELGSGTDVLVIERDSNGKFKQSGKNKSSGATSTTTPEFLIDEDNMASNSATKVPSQQSVKAYVDSQVATADALSELSGDTDDLTEGSSNLFHTSERVDDRVAAFLTAGTGITLTHDDANNSLTIAGAAQYGDSDVDDHLSGGTGVTYSSGTISIGQAVATSDSPSFAGLTLTGNASITGNIVPSADNTYDLGSSSNTWRDVYVGPGSLYVNGQQVVSDSSGTIVVSADSNQNVSVQTSGSGDVELDPTGTGSIQLKGPVEIQAGNNVTSSDGNAISFANSIDVDAIESRSTNTNLVLSANGTGVVAVSDSMTISGDLTVSGTTTTVNSETINLADNIIALNSNFTSGSPTEDSGISITRGGSTAKTLLWDETNDRWTVGSESFVAGTFIGAVTGDVTGNASTASALSSAVTVSLSGDASGSATFTSAGDTASISVTVADDSHNHVISNVDGLQTALDTKYESGDNITAGTITTSNASNSGGYVRNIYQSTSTPASGDGAVGDLWIYYS